MFKSQLGSVVHTIPPIVNNGNYEGKMANVGNECTNALGLINIYIYSSSWNIQVSELYFIFLYKVNYKHHKLNSMWNITS